MSATSEPLSQEEIQKFKRLAAAISGDDMLERMIQQSRPSQRRFFYDSLIPYLTFKPKPFWWYRQRINGIKTASVQ